MSVQIWATTADGPNFGYRWCWFWQDDDCEEPMGPFDTREETVADYSDLRDPTPWCSGCGAKHKRDCDCGPIADND